MVGTVLKAKVSDLEEEIREGFFVVVKDVVDKRRYSVRFQDGEDRDM